MRGFGEWDEGVVEGHDALQAAGLSHAGQHRSAARAEPDDGLGRRDRLRGGKVVAGENLPVLCLRRRRGDQAGQGTVAAVRDGDGEFDGVADAQDIRRQSGLANGEVADGPGKAGQHPFAREGADVQLNWLRLEQSVARQTARIRRRAGEHNRPGEAAGRRESLCEHRELPRHHRREGGLVDESGHYRPTAGRNIVSLTDPAQVHQYALARSIEAVPNLAPHPRVVPATGCVP